MTAVSWLARDRNAVGLSADPAASSGVLQWSPDPGAAGSALPWATPEYPTFLILGIGVTLTTSATVATRRLSLTLAQVNGAQTQWLSSGTQLAGLGRRWECAVGFALDTTLAGTVYREPLPYGFMLLPGVVGGTIPTLTVAIDNAQAGDVLGPITLRGTLLYP